MRIRPCALIVDHKVDARLAANPRAPIAHPASRTAPIVRNELSETEAGSVAALQPAAVLGLSHQRSGDSR